MSSESLQPTSLDPAGPSPTPEGPGPSSARKMAWIAVALVVVGLGLIGWIAQREPSDIPPPDPTPTVERIPTATPDPALRLAAEAALEKVIGLMGQVRDTVPERWAGEVWGQIEVKNEAGDQAMADRRWEEAIAAYGATAGLLEPLVAQLPEVPSRLVALAEAAIAAGEKNEAVALVRGVLFLDPENAEALALQPRAEVADRSFAALQQGLALLAENDLDAAFVQVQTLEELDPLFPGFDALETEVEAQLTQRELGVLIGRITAALDAGDLETAEAALAEAMALDAAHPAVRDAGGRVEALRTTRRILELKEEAEGFAAQERWQEAHQRWLDMKALDPGAPWVEEGLQTSLRWAVIDAKLSRGFLKPGSDQTGAWVKEFGDRKGWPSKLSAKADRLEEVYRAWTTPVKVVLVSDGETEVTLRRVGRWKEVVRKELALLPGDYTATGGRLGYRDVRVSFTVPPGDEPVEVEVICTEGI